MATWRLLIGFSSWVETLNRARRLVDLAEQHPDSRDPLLGAALILSAVALDQALLFFLKMAIPFYADQGEAPLAERAAELLRGSAWMRIKESPQLHHQRPFELNLKNDYVRYLRELVERRNRLLHLEEEPIQLDMTIPDASEPESPEAVRAAMQEATADQSAIERVRLRREWADVTPAEVRRALAAVHLYLDAVVDETESSKRSAHQLSVPTP